MKQAKNPIKVNFEDGTIVVSRPFAIRAADPVSPEYRRLTNVQESYPEYKIVVRTIRKANNEHYKGLTYSYMEYYISTHENAEARMSEYNEMRLRAECHSMKYGHIKKWFLSAYPQIDDFTPEDFQKKCCENCSSSEQIGLIAEGAVNEARAA